MVTTDQVLLLVASAVAGGLISGGTISAIGYRALKDKLVMDLSTVFPRKSELNRLEQTVEQMRTVAMSANDLSAQNADTLIRLQEAERITRERIMDTLNRLDQRMTLSERDSAKLQNEITRTVTLLDSLEKRMDRHISHKEG